MGCPNSKHKPTSRKRVKTNVAPPEEQNGNNIRVQSIQIDDEQNISIVRKELEEHPETFVLNNLFMSIQFFENYQRDIVKLQHTSASKMEKQLNRLLLKQETMECTNPDTILEKVRENVRYRPLHGQNKFYSTPLAAKRIYVVNDLIEVINTMDIPQYTSIDKPSYQVRIEESTRKGFVRLKQIEVTKTPIFQSTDITDIKHFEPQPGPSSAPDSETYDYSTITELLTPKPLDVIKNPERRDTLPLTCFTERKILKPTILSDSDSEEEEDTFREITEDDLFETVTYINSKGFMKYFQNALFPNSLGRALGFDEPEISQAKAIPGKIFCNGTDEEDNPIPCEVIPSVAIDWPGEQTFEFLLREDRPTITDRRTGYRYRWPTNEMLVDIKSMSCVLVPRGYLKKKGEYLDTDIEWEINFPKAERYIEARMSHTQMRCFLFLLTLHKTFIEPVTMQHGLLVEHIRTHMYWECEANYMEWPEHRLGTKILRVIKNLYDCISRGILSDYFIKQRNLFENIPKKYLRFAQKVLHDVLETPVMYFLASLKNLRYTNWKFYPPLEHKELYQILTKKGISIINPSAVLSSTPLYVKRKKFADAETQWRHIQDLKKREQVLKQKQAEQANLKDDKERRDSTESIDFQWTCEKKFDMYKTKAILRFFIDNFIQVAKTSAKISTKEQTLFYLKQAWYLASILEYVSPAFIVEAEELKEKIAKEEDACKRQAVSKNTSELPPSTPVRNSIQFDFNQQLKNNTVNLSKLHNSYSNGGHQMPVYKLKKIPETNNAPRKSVIFG